MPYTMPSTKSRYDVHLARFQAAFGETAPQNENSFFKVLAAALAMSDREVYAYGKDREMAMLASTAQGDDLDKLGNSRGIYRSTGTTWEGVITLAVPDGVLLPAATYFVSDYGYEYYTKIQQRAPWSTPGTGVRVPIRAVLAGSGPNLDYGSLLKIKSKVPNMGDTAEVVDVTSVGSTSESDESYRQRIIDFNRGISSGGESANGTTALDYRTWAQNVTGVERAYPYTGAPDGSVVNPGQRSVFVQCTIDINPDGVTPQYLLDDVREAILKDPDTGNTREILGITSQDLFVRSIRRSDVNFVITGLQVQIGSIGDAQQAVISGLQTYMTRYRPYIAGVDGVETRADTVLVSVVSAQVQNIITPMNGSFDSLTIQIDGNTVAEYQVAPDELLKLGAITWQ